MRAQAPRVAAVLLGLLGTAAWSQSAYVRSQVRGGHLCTWWPERRYELSVDAAGYSKNDRTADPRAEFAAIDAALQGWQTVASACSDFVFERGPDVLDPQVGYVQDAPDNSNVITFREASCLEAIPPGDPCFVEGGCANRYRCWDHGDGVLALTTTTHRVANGTLLDADIEFNAAPMTDGTTFLFTTTASPPCDPATGLGFDCVASDIQNTFTHEIGHAIGLDHAEVPGSTMEASAPLGETDKRSIDRGTAEGFCAIYPRAGATPVICDDPGEASSQIVAVGRGSPGFTAMGCSTAAGAPLVSFVAALLSLLWLRKRP